MASWLALSLLVLVSANAVLSAKKNDYKDKLIDEDPYLSQCFVSTGTGDLKQDGVKKIHSGPECYAKSKIKFNVEDSGSHFVTYNEQGEGYDLPATIRYKFGDCYDLKIGIEKDENDKIVYFFYKPDGEKLPKLVDGFAFRMIRRSKSNSDDLDTMELISNWKPLYSEKCNAFEKAPTDEDDKPPTWMDFEQEILSGVPDLTLIWKVPIEIGKYFGEATAQEIIELGTSTTTTTTTAEPTTSSSTTSKPSTTSSLVSSTATNTTVAPTELVDEVKEEAFPWWIIAVVGVLLLLLLIGLLVGYLCWRRRGAQKPKPVAPQTETTVGTTMETVQEKSQYGPNMMYFARDAKPTAPK